MKVIGVSIYTSDVKLKDIRVKMKMPALKMRVIGVAHPNIAPKTKDDEYFCCDRFVLDLDCVAFCSFSLCETLCLLSVTQ